MNNFRRISDTNPKILQYKQRILEYFMLSGPDTFTTVAKKLDLSVPTATKFINELCAENVLSCYGKLETAGGRHPHIYGLNPACYYFIGVDLGLDRLHIALIDFTGNKITEYTNTSFCFTNEEGCLDTICEHINTFIGSLSIPRADIGCIGVNIFGRLNPETGYSYTYFNFDEQPLSEKLSSKLGIVTFIDNDTRACAYGEYMLHLKDMGENILFVNLAWGLGLGIIINGEPYMGHSGFAGEFGHIHAYNNEILCHCGKKGCLETEASGSAMYRKFIKRIQGGGTSILVQGAYAKPLTEIKLDDIIWAVRNEDILCIDLLEEIGGQLGMHIAGLINLFNPDIVVIGGTLSSTGDYLMHSIRSAIRKYSLNVVNQDTLIRLSLLQEHAGSIGACMLARKKLIASITT